MSKAADQSTPAPMTGTALPMPPPVPVVLSDKAQEKLNVTNLMVPKVDKSHTFENLTKMKLSKKDRHMETMDAFQKMLERLSEEIEVKVLDISRAVRERLENIDIDLQRNYDLLQSHEYLVVKSEEQIGDLRENLQLATQRRCRELDEFEATLEALEVYRANTVSKELKSLLDRLIAIAYQLPNEIEYAIETETFEFNAVLTSNRKNHAILLGMMRTRQVEVEVESIHRWEECKRLWRHLRHELAVQQYRDEMTSETYINPLNRQHYMAQFREGQLQRNGIRSKCLVEYGQLGAANATSDIVESVKAKLTALNEQEIEATQKCHDDLQAMRRELLEAAEKRREGVRLELHAYGSLEAEPPMKEYANQLESCLNDPELSEMMRLGGGLKPDLQVTVSDMRSDSLMYIPHVEKMKERLALIVSSFGIKDVMQERGRIMRLEPIRTCIMKMKSVPRKEVFNVVRSVIPDLEEIVGVDKMPMLFRDAVRSCLVEMQAEVAKVEEFMAAGSQDDIGSATQSQGRVSLGTTNGAGIRTAKGVVATAKGGTGRASRATSSLAGSKTSLSSEVDPNSVINPFSVKAWWRTLGLLYYGCLLPEKYRLVCQESLRACDQQIKCNHIVDKVVLEESAEFLRKIDLRYNFLINGVTTYLEAQINIMSVCCTNLYELYISIARNIEMHRKMQHDIDEKAADLLWDYSEEYRLHREDLEHAYDQACMHLRQSADYDTLQHNFEKVLQCLSDIQDSYRIYHEKACFLADMHPLRVATEFNFYLNKLCKVFFLRPINPHPILESQKRILATVQRLNKKYYQDDPPLVDIPMNMNTTSATVPGSSMSGDRVMDAAISQADEVSPNTSGPTQGVEEEESELIDVSTQLPMSSEMFPGGYFVSSLFDEREGIPKNTVGGRYGIKTTESKLIEDMFEDSNMRDERAKLLEAIRKEEEEEAEREASKAAEVSSAPVLDPTPAAGKGAKPKDAKAAAAAAAQAAAEAEAARLAAEARKPKVRTDIPFLLAGSESTLPSIPSVDDMAALDPYDEQELESLIAQNVVILNDDDKSNAFSNNPKELSELYDRCLCIRDRAIRRRRYASDPEYILESIPIDINRRPLLERVQVSADAVIGMVKNAQIAFIVHMEDEAFKKAQAMDELNKERKSKLTEELEDRLRTHWPRRGRVETQLKQPRDAELLSHQEKTFRIIRQLQEKVLEVQAKFSASLDAAQGSVSKYVQDMDSVINSLKNVAYKTLATLQGVDVKGRDITQTFQTDCTRQVNGLTSIATVDIEAVIAQAQDFRKLCPLQTVGPDGIPTQGYSEDEINHIQSLIDAQEQEIKELMEVWNGQINALKESHEEALKKQDQMSACYAQVAQDLALSEGLGQKYGAPRRRAQERLRSEISRDEQSAGKIDELIARLQFEVSEAGRRYETGGPETTALAEDALERIPPHQNGRDEYDVVNYTWDLFVAIRKALAKRANYLKVFADGLEPDLSTIPWMAAEYIPRVDPPEDSVPPANREIPADDAVIVTGFQHFFMVMDEAEAECKKETVQLYESEGRGALIKSFPGGIPESLALWLQESRKKLLAPGGHREKAWKRLWGQVEALDTILARSLGPLNSPEPKLGLPAMSLRGVQVAFISYIKCDRFDRQDKFSKVINVLVKARTKHDRLLRPRLGSPDASQELNQLDSTEKQRSVDFSNAVLEFRSGLVKHLATIAKSFVEVVCIVSTSHLAGIDNTTRLEILQVPPDTEVPKKRMTLKKLRKVERIQASVSAGAEDISKSRVWPPISPDSMIATLRAIDDMIRPEDRDVAVAVEPSPAVDAKAPKAAAGKKGAAPVAAEPTQTVEANPTSIVTDTWLKTIAEKSAKRALVSSAHRLLVNERDAAVETFFNQLKLIFDSIRASYDTMLEQERSWSDRWSRQVEMLKNM
jgi:hypothetical protein